MKSLRTISIAFAIASLLLAALASASPVGAQGAEVTEPDCNIAGIGATDSHDVLTPSGNENLVCHYTPGGNAAGGGGPAITEEVSCGTHSGNVPGKRVITPSGNRILHCHYPQGA